MEALGLEPDIVFDITVEGNRPDAWCITGIARDLAGRLGLPFAAARAARARAQRAARRVGGVGASVESPDLCPRLTVSVLDDVAVGPSPRWIARRLLLAGMRPINNVVDASNYVMLELGQPTHPYDLSRLPGRGLTVRRARPGETVETLDGVPRTVGVRGRGLGDTGEDCLICDAEGTPVGIGGVMGGASSEIADSTTEVLLEAAYFTPMAIARTSKRLGLRTEASARFERGCDPWGIEPSVRRFCQLLAESVPGLRVADGMLDVRGEVPEPFVVSVPIARVQRQIGVALGHEEIARLIEPIGFTVVERGGVEGSNGGDGVVTVIVPTNRPDVRPEPYGVDDVIEEIARTFGYSQRATPRPDVAPAGTADGAAAVAALGQGRAGAGWARRRAGRTPSSPPPRTPTSGSSGPAVRVANPLDAEKPFLRRSLMPGLLGALAYNASRRQPAVRLFEVGVVFSHPGEGAPRVVERSGAGGTERAELPGEREMLSAVFARDDDDARDRGGRVARAGRGDAPRRGAAGAARRRAGARSPGLHPTRSAHLVAHGGRRGSGHDRLRRRDRSRSRRDVRAHPHLAVRGRSARRVGWLEVDLGLLFDEARRAPAGHGGSGAVSRFPRRTSTWPSWSTDAHPADAVADALRAAGGRTAGVGDASSTCTEGPGSTRARAAWPTACASAHPSAR